MQEPWEKDITVELLRDGWYFRTVEGRLGPFRTEAEADSALRAFEDSTVDIHTDRNS